MVSARGKLFVSFLSYHYVRASFFGILRPSRSTPEAKRREQVAYHPGVLPGVCHFEGIGLRSSCLKSHIIPVYCREYATPKARAFGVGGFRAASPKQSGGDKSPHLHRTAFGVHLPWRAVPGVQVSASSARLRSTSYPYGYPCGMTRRTECFWLPQAAICHSLAPHASAGVEGIGLRSRRLRAAPERLPPPVLPQMFLI